MIRASRRAVLGGALAVPTISGLAAWRWKHGDGRALVHDAGLAAGQRFAQAGKASGLPSRPIEGDRVRFMQDVLAPKPALITGVSRFADLLLIADIAREAGYVLAAEVEGRGEQCAGSDCRPGWTALGRMTRAAGADWPAALAGWAADPRGALVGVSRGAGSRQDGGLVLGWVLTRRG